MAIQSLNQESANKWSASYDGNYGIYKIKISLDDNNNLKNYNCSCPSDYNPCKHIDMILKAISKKITINNTKQQKENHSELIKSLFNGKLKDKFIHFLIEYADYNTDFVNKLKKDFFTEKSVKSSIKINQIISDGMPSGNLENDYDDYGYNGHYEEDIEIEIFDEWKEKADLEIKNKNLDDALDIAKAMFEEYYIWLDYCDSDYLDYVSDHYEDYPFEIFKSIFNANKNLKEQIFDYLKEKYQVEDFKKAQNTISHFIYNNSDNEIDNLFFLETQKQLLLECKTDSEQESFLAKIIDFYLMNDNKDKAWKLIFENIKFDKFRNKVIEKYINEENYKGAKELIFERLRQTDNYRTSDWNKYLLQIARLEKNIEDIRTYSFIFIKDTFESEYYKIYKATFQEKEWKIELKKIENNYNNKQGFSNSLVQLWLFENKKKEAIDYFLFQKNIEVFENYVSNFITEYPKETLEIYKLSLDKYVLNYLGRNHYEYVAKVLDRIKKVSGGKELVEKMVLLYKIEYKKRPAMMEILNKNFK